MLDFDGQCAFFNANFENVAIILVFVVLFILDVHHQLVFYLTVESQSVFNGKEFFDARNFSFAI